VLSNLDVMVIHVWFPGLIATDMQAIREHILSFLKKKVETIISDEQKDDPTNPGKDKIMLNNQFRRPEPTEPETSLHFPFSTKEPRENNIHHDPSAAGNDDDIIDSYTDRKRIINSIEFFSIAHRISQYFMDSVECKVIALFEELKLPGSFLPKSWLLRSHLLRISSTTYHSNKVDGSTDSNKNNRPDSSNAFGETGDTERIQSPAEEDPSRYFGVISLKNILGRKNNLYHEYLSIFGEKGWYLLLNYWFTWFMIKPFYIQDMIVQWLNAVFIIGLLWIHWSLYTILPYLVVIPTGLVILFYLWSYVRDAVNMIISQLRFKYGQTHYNKRIKKSNRIVDINDINVYENESSFSLYQQRENSLSDERFESLPVKKPSREDNRVYPFMDGSNHSLSPTQFNEQYPMDPNQVPLERQYMMNNPQMMYSQQSIPPQQQQPPPSMMMRVEDIEHLDSDNQIQNPGFLPNNNSNNVMNQNNNGNYFLDPTMMTMMMENQQNQPPVMTNNSNSLNGSSMNSSNNSSYRNDNSFLPVTYSQQLPQPVYQPPPPIQQQQPPYYPNPVSNNMPPIQTYNNNNNSNNPPPMMMTPTNAYNPNSNNNNMNLQPTMQPFQDNSFQSPPPMMMMGMQNDQNVNNNNLQPSMNDSHYNNGPPPATNMMTPVPNGNYNANNNNNNNANFNSPSMSVPQMNRMRIPNTLQDIEDDDDDRNYDDDIHDGYFKRR
jgi:hypothetical protein